MFDLKTIQDMYNRLKDRVEGYLNDKPQPIYLDFNQQQDITLVSNMYSHIVQTYSDFLLLYSDIQFFITRCKKLLAQLPNNTKTDQAVRSKVKAIMDLTYIYVDPMETERERLKTAEMFYRSICNRRDY